MAKKKAAKKRPTAPRKRAAAPKRSGKTRPSPQNKRLVPKTRHKKNVPKKVAKKSAARSYSTATIKELFGLCSNQCAYPNCTNEIIATGTKLSNAAVVGHICHIYAAADNGPRGKPGLTAKERNTPENLILMCGHHHPLIDKQWRDYPATILLQWKNAHEAKARPGTAEAIKREEDIQKHAFVEQMSDEQIEKAIARIRRGRYLVGFPTRDEARALATQVERSKFSGGSDEVRARALAWCARIFSQGQTIKQAEDLLEKSKAISQAPDAIAMLTRSALPFGSFPLEN
jgi:hypothetical protein